MKTLLVTPFAPYRDGIASYAVQELRQMRQCGDHVDVLSPLPSAARWHLRLGGPKGLVRLGNKAAEYERTVIQFGPEMLFGGCGSAARRVAVWAGLAALAKRTSLDVRIHEIEYGPLEHNPLERRAARFALEQADRVTVHTEAERQRLDRLIGLGRRIEVVDHGRDFQPAAVLAGPEARAELGLPTDRFLFVAIGFLQHHKGFDLAVDAMESINAANAELHIVGSARVDHPDIVGYVDRLSSRCRSVAGVTLHQRFVSDVEFDLWLQAADVVVLPYREIWSSGVVERARLFGTQILASDLPQLRDQTPDRTVFFGDVHDLTVAMEKLIGASQHVVGFAADVAGSDRTGAGRADDMPVDGDAPPGRVRRQPWTVDGRAPDRQSVQAQVMARARAAELSRVGTRPGPADHLLSGQRRPVDPLLALGHLHRPQPTSARPGVAPVKRLINRLIGWQIEPLAQRVEDLQRSTIEAVDQLDRAQPQANDQHDAPPAEETAMDRPPPEPSGRQSAEQRPSESSER